MKYNVLDKRISVGGHSYAVFGGIVEYNCKKTRATAMSSQQAECYAACDTAKTGNYLHSLFPELNLMHNEPILMC
jgi:hypothetical protein